MFFALKQKSYETALIYGIMVKHNFVLEKGKGLWNLISSSC